MSELKFDRARFDAGEHPTRTRDGSKVLKLVDSGLDCEYPIVAWVQKEGLIETYTYTRNGCYWTHRDDHDNDLVHEPKKRTVRVCLYRPAREATEVYAVSEDWCQNYGASVREARAEGRFIAELTHEVEE